MKKIISLISCLIIISLTITFSACNGCSSCNGCNGCGKESKLSQYEITCELTDNVLTGNEEFTFYNQYENSVSVLKFNLFPNAYRENAKYSPVLPQHVSLSYPDGVNYGKIEITSVCQDQTEIAFSVCGKDQNILQVNLPNEVFPGEYATVTINFKVVIAKIVSRLGINQKTVNLANFYPILCGYDNGFYECVYYGIGDPFFSDCANYKVSITADSSLIVAGGGETLSCEQKNGKKTTSFSLQNARSFAMVLSKDFKTLSQTVGDTKITYYYYDDADAQCNLKHAVNALTFFNETFGEYPYSTYSVVQTMFVQGGMEFPTITFISDSIEGSAYGEVIVHETAHQWWQTVVGNNEIEYGFLDEGLAEYSVVLYYENYPEYGLTRERLVASAEQTYKVFCSVVDRLDGKVNSVMLRSLKDFSTEYEYVNIAYIKPCIMYNTLRNTIGDQAFFKGLKRYYKEYAFKNATPDDIVGVYEKIGADTNGFFESFYQGKAIL